MISNQSLTCPKGTSLTFEIDMDTGSDLTGATAQWALAESWFDQAKVYLTKTGVGDGLFINQDAGIWKITVNIAPSDTLDVPSGMLYHDCKVLLQSGDVEDVANGPFSLDPSVNILDTNAPITRNLHALQALGRPGQVAALTVGALARNLSVAQSLGGLTQSAAATVTGVTWVGPTWSPTDHSEFIAISGTNNEIATRNSAFGGTWCNARSDTGQTTGVRLVELTVGQITGGAIVGVGNGAENLTGAVSQAGNNSIGYLSGGGVQFNGGWAAAVPPGYTTGDVAGMLIDLDANTIAFRTNGGTWSSTESIAPLRPSGDPIFIMVSISDTVGNALTLVNE